MLFSYWLCMLFELWSLDYKSNHVSYVIVGTCLCEKSQKQVASGLNGLNQKIVCKVRFLVGLRS